MTEFTFPYRTSVERVEVGPGCAFEIERLASLDETIDDHFREYERTGRAELFEEHCPYFGVPWPSGLTLARIAHARAAAWRGRKVLELGCGLALPSLVLAGAGARVVAADMHPDVPSFLERNLRRNGLEGRVEVLRASWAEPATLPRAELVLGSDLVYGREQPASLVACLHALPEWREAWFVDPGRPYWESFLAAVRAKGWGLRENFELGNFTARIARNPEDLLSFS